MKINTWMANKIIPLNNPYVNIASLPHKSKLLLVIILCVVINYILNYMMAVNITIFNKLDFQLQNYFNFTQHFAKDMKAKGMYHQELIRAQFHKRVTLYYIYKKKKHFFIS